MNRFGYVRQAIRWVALLIVLLSCHPSAAQEMTMPGMENSVGALSSGTSIQPKVTSEFEPMIHRQLGDWTLGFHANAFFIDTQQSGPRGGDKFYAVNWFMPMIMRRSGRGSITLRTMLSLEPLTVTGRRYPELFQSGETAYGVAVVDGQHPHDLLMEISGRYDFRVTEKTSIFLYGGPIAEPALGPTAFPHRASASENPSAVLGHHEQDSTHISNSVLTAGLSRGPLQVEGSAFHGREPNENRWNLDGGRPDSFSSRLTLSAGQNLSGQFSIGRINNREALEPGLDTVRTTASVQHNAPLPSGHIATSLIWGRNKDLESNEVRVFNAYVLESTARFMDRNWIWTRVENVDRDRTLLSGETSAALSDVEAPVGRIQAYTFGYERDLLPGASAMRLGLGAQFTTFGLPPVLRPAYGDRPIGVSVFLRIRPSGNTATHMQMMHGR
jgi:hypothetical protein